MAKYLKPRRGTLTNARTQRIVLQKGEMFLEMSNNDSIGNGPGRIVIGNGSTAYQNLNYHSTVANTFRPFITDPSIYVPQFNNDNCTVPSSGWSVNSASGIINTDMGNGSTASNVTLPIIIRYIKQALALHDSSITKLNNGLTKNGFTINSGGGYINKISPNGSTYQNPGSQYAYISAAGSTYESGQNYSTISITNGQVNHFADIDMNATTNTHTLGFDISVNTRLKLQSGIDESATTDVTTLGQSTAAYFYLGSESFIGGEQSTPSSSFRTVLYPDKLYLIADPMAGSTSHLYLNDTGIICSNGWGYSDKTDIHTAFINAPSYVYSTKITPNATTTSWNTVTVPALKNFNRVYFVVKVGDAMVQNTFIDKRTNGNAATMTYSALASTTWFAAIHVSVHFNEGTVSVKWKSGTGWAPAQCDISALWIHPMDHIA